MESKSTVNIGSHPPVSANVATMKDKSVISEYENSWRSKFPRLFIIILSIMQTILTLIISALEIASLNIRSRCPSTGVGIWCSVPFITAIILTFILVLMKEGSRIWSTRVLIAQLILLIFTFILIGITGNYVATIDCYDYFTILTTNYNGKYRLVQAELAFGILLMFSGLVYVGIYIFITYIALWKPFHTIDTDHLFHE